MKRKIKLSILLLAVTVAIASSCKKDNDKNDDTAKTKTELLTTGTWKLNAYTSTPAYDWYNNGVYATDILAALNPCEADGFDTYKSNEIVEINEGTLKCISTDPQTFTATWSFMDNENKIIYDGFDEYELIEINSEQNEITANI